MLTQGKLRFAGIGPRDTPLDVLPVMTAMGKMFADLGWIGVSGFATGPDQAWLQDIPETQQEVWLPWWTYNDAREYHDPHGRFNKISVTSEIHQVAKDHYKGYKPNQTWDELSNGSKLLFARNVAIMARDTLDTAVNLVAYWQSPEGEAKIGGGTNHAVRVAKTIHIPCFNIYHDHEVDAMSSFVEVLSAQASHA